MNELVYQVKGIINGKEVNFLTTFDESRAIETSIILGIPSFVEQFYKTMPGVPGKTIFKNDLYKAMQLEK